MENSKVTVHAQGESQAQKRLEKTLSLQLSVTHATETAHNNRNTKTIKTITKTANARQEERLISKVTTLLDSNVQYSRTKATNHTKETEKYGPFKGKNNKLIMSLKKTGWQIY